MLSACSSDDGGVTGGAAANPAFNGIFIGNTLINPPAGSSALMDTITMNLTVGSPLAGTIQFESLGVEGTISGTANGDMASFTFAITVPVENLGDCTVNMQGTMLLEVPMDGPSIDVEASGTDDCTGGSWDLMATTDAMEDCDDLQDNDSDRLIDYDDPDCVGDPACPPPSV